MPDNFGRRRFAVSCVCVYVCVCLFQGKVPEIVDERSEVDQSCLARVACASTQLS